jgi:hypothetical protein
MVLDALKKRLQDAANSKWIKELPNALWGLRTQPSKPTGQSPYFLVYGSEAILPTEVMWDSPAVEHYDEGVSEDSRRVDIDGLEEARCAALVQSARYLEGIRRYHDRNVKKAPSTLVILSSVASKPWKDYTSSARPGKVPSQLQRCPDRAPTASRHLKAKTLATRETSTNSVDSTHSLHDYPGGSSLYDYIKTHSL